MLGDFVRQRYASYDSGVGQRIESRSIGFAELEEIALNSPEPRPVSGKQEYLENLILSYTAHATSKGSPLMITIGIDCGTQSTKTIALDPDTNVVLAQASMGYE